LKWRCDGWKDDAGPWIEIVLFDDKHIVLKESLQALYCFSGLKQG
jgi:hypothetical protein